MLKRLQGNLRAIFTHQQEMLWGRKANRLFWEAPVMWGRTKPSEGRERWLDFSAWWGQTRNHSELSLQGPGQLAG